MRRILLLTISILSIISCDDNEVDKPGAKTASITFANNSLLKGWVILSDTAGKVLSTAAVDINASATLEYPITDTNDKCTLTFIRWREYDNSYFAATYLKIGPGNYNNKETIITTPITGIHRVEMGNTNVYNITLQTEGVCGIRNAISNPLQYEIDICGTSSYLYAQFQKGSEVPRYFLKKVEINGSTTLNEALYLTLPPMKSKPFAVDANMTGWFVLKGVTPSSSEIIASLNYFEQNKSTALLYYPELSTFFKGYVTTLSYSRSTNIKISYNVMQQAAEPSFVFSEIQASVDKVMLNSGGKLQLALSGQAQYVKGFLPPYNIIANGKAGNISWHVYAPFSKTTEINLPQIPTEVLGGVDLDIARASQFVAIELGEDDETKTYTELYKKLLSGPGILNLKNGRNKIYNMN